MAAVRMRVCGAVLIALGCWSPGAIAQGEWTTVLDGTTLNGWNQIGTANWTVAEGAVEATSGNGFLVTPASYGDFQITLEFWVSDDANSGVFIRCDDPTTVSAENAYEVNIYDTRPDQAYRTGAIVDVAKPASVIMTGGRWNTFDITARGTTLTVVLNGTRTVQVQDTKHARGPIALQYAAGVVRFRNVRIRSL
jgi:hypothetical protein